MLDPKQLEVIKKAAQREEWSAVGDVLVALSAQAAGNPIDIVRLKGLAPLIHARNREDISWAIDQLLRVQNRSASK